jgi:ubiquinone/menaquinone biosynthesis C-methylase UbiE
MIPNPTERFTGRVESYRRYRPGYPGEMVDLLRRECGLNDASLVADVAAGTGLLTEVLLAAGLPVVAVEPNGEMRATCAELEPKFPRLRCVAGTAEATGLPDASVDLITVAQAMHWFDLEKTRAEFARVLKPGGGCAVLYNNRRLSGDAFHEAYERFLLRVGTDYTKVKEQHVGRKRLAQFFAPSSMKCAVLPNAQSLTFDALLGRVLSSSYIPQPGQSGYQEMATALERLFSENEHDGTVTMVHDCVVCYGQLG